MAATGGSFAFIIAGVVVPWLVARNAHDGWRDSWFVFGVLAISIGMVSLVFLWERPCVGQEQGPEGGSRSGMTRGET